MVGVSQVMEVVGEHHPEFIPVLVVVALVEEAMAMMVLQVETQQYRAEQGDHRDT